MQLLNNLKKDLPASLVVALVALPLCLGIALASGAPLFSGIISGVVGGIIVGMLSKSPLSVSGPAAGLTVIVLSAIQSLPSYQAFLVCVVLAGCIQMLLGFCQAGIVSDFFPASVIKGMLAAIGLILILKQLPHAVGYDVDYEGDDSFFQADGENTLSAVMHLWEYSFVPGAILISLTSLIFLFAWDMVQKRKSGPISYIPGQLIVVFFGVLANELFKTSMPNFAIGTSHLVSIPVLESLADIKNNIILPDFSFIADKAIWSTAVTIAVIASIETLLSIEAIDKLDPYKRVTPKSRELVAQGVGNITSGMLGGLPVTSVIVRSSANAQAGAQTGLSAIMHGVILMVCVLLIPTLMNLIPLSALAAILIHVGYKLTRPSLYLMKYRKGWPKFIPFVATILAILFTDLLIGITIGMIIGVVFVLVENYNSALLVVADNNNYLVRAKKDLFFLHKFELRRSLAQIPDNAQVLIDVSRLTFIDLDNVEIINYFIEGAKHRNIHITIKRRPEIKATNLIEEPDNESL